MIKHSAIAGRVVLEITSADSCGFINSLINDGVYLQDVTFVDNLTTKVTTTYHEYKRILAFAEKQGQSVSVLRKLGLRWKINALKKRPVLMICCILALIFACFLQSRVLFFRVDGNHFIPENMILEAAEECGIRFGVSRRKIRSEKMKNALLEKIPQLQWAGINTAGCTATISVREKTEPEETELRPKQVASIIAARDGIIQNCTVYQGNPLCAVGQAVKAGQTLVSGYTDCGIITKATQARAEINALTYRQLELVTPEAEYIRGECVRKITKYSLRIGKKVIKFLKDSGNSSDLCVKIYSEEYWQLPGGFKLPVALIKETSYIYDENTDRSTLSEAESWLTDYAKDYLENVMIAGKVISSQAEIIQDDSVCNLYGKYTCIEMIGQVRVEQTILGEGTND